MPSTTLPVEFWTFFFGLLFLGLLDRAGSALYLVLLPQYLACLLSR